MSCADCIVAEYPACDKGIPCCKCAEVDCSSRQPCPKTMNRKSAVK